MDLPSVLDDLWSSMRHLYQARYKATGREGGAGERPYPDMDRDTFDEIAVLQTKLQTLISRLEAEKQKCSTSSDKSTPVPPKP